METVNTTGAIKVEVAEKNGSFQLLRNGQPYQIKGAGLEGANLADFARHGGNSFRTWTTDREGQTGQQVLDDAFNNGLTVSMTLSMGAEHWGFDYNDDAAVARQFELIKQQVVKYKDHPALLIWIIGNELNYDFTNPKVFDAINEVSRMIHKLDPNHPTTTAIAGYSKEIIELLQQRSPDLDLISLQMYGDLINLPTYIERDDISLPLMITEWGAVGHWEVNKTSWGAPIEHSSSNKASNYLNGYRKVIEALSHQVVGSYVFLWGQKQERTGTWYGMFTDTGEETETVDTMHYIWNNQWPKNRSPLLESLSLNDLSARDNIRLKANSHYEAEAKVRDPDGDNLTYRWELRPESTANQSGGAKEEIPAVINGLIVDSSVQKIRLTTPSSPGAFRLFVYAYDGNNHAAHANIPFYVIQ